MNNTTAALMSGLMLAVILGVFLWQRKRTDSAAAGAGALKAKRTRGKSAKEPGNSSKDDLLRTVTAVGTFARRNRYFLYFPGTLRIGEEIQVMSALLITRSEIIGICCYGFGGTIEAQNGNGDWVQTLNGKRTRIPSPVVRNKERLRFLRRALKEVGLDEYPSEVLGVFTSPTVELKNAKGTGCYTEKELLETLKARRFSGGGKVPVKAAAVRLQPVMYRESES